ncbi:MAG TPA: ABC transporter permease [Clostridium sp.]|uniref:ABC transporter permease n=1 Tax=Clostridium sp. TaxID=1506 RepID=UPI002F91CE68
MILNIKKNNFKNLSVGGILLKLRTLIALIVLLIIFSIITPNFLTSTTLILIGKHSGLIAILAIGMTFVIVSGGIDLSVGSIVGFSAMIAGGLIFEGLKIPIFGVTIYFNVIMIIIITLIVGTLVGGLNGLLISKLNVPPFIATLGMLYVARGFALIRSNGQTFPNLVGSSSLGNTGFPYLGEGVLLGLPISIWIMIVIVAVAAYLSKKTPLGWHIYALGGNEKAAKLSGVRINKVKMFVYMFSGFCAAMVGLIVASQLVAAHPATGESWELNAIAATVLGGTSMSGGVGTIGGTLIGAFIIGVLNDGMIMIGVSSFWQMVIKGTVIVLAVIADQAQRNFQNKVTH